MIASAAAPSGDRQRQLLVDPVTDDAICQLDRAGVVSTWSSGAELSLGYAASEIVGQHCSRLFPRELGDGGGVDGALREAAQRGRFAKEGWCERKDGSRFWAHTLINPLQDGKGAPSGFALVTRDLTPSKTRAVALRDNEAALAARFRVLVTQVRDYAIFMLDPAGRISSWNAGAARMKGYEEAEALGRHLSVFYTPEDVAAGRPERMLEEAIALGRAEDEGWRVRKDGSRFWANAVLTSLRDPGGALLGFAKVTRDLTERQLATTRLLEERAARGASEAARTRSAFLADLGAALADSRDLPAAIQRVARLALPTLGDYCIVDLRTPEGKAELLTLAHVDPSLEPLVAALRQLQAPEVTDSHPTPRVLQTGKSDLVPHITDAMLQRAARSPEYLDVLRRLHPTSHMVVPMLVGGRPTGTVSFVSTRPERHFDEVDLSLAEDLAHRVALVIENRRLYEAEQGARVAAEQSQARLQASVDQLEILAKAGALLGASLDYEATLQHLANLVVPKLADWCAVHIPDESGRLRSVAVAHTNPDKVKWARALGRRYEARVDEARGVGHVLRTGQREVYRSISDELLRSAARDAEHERILRELGMTSALLEPLTTHGKTIGTLTLVHAESGQTFTDSDIELVAELARRAAMAVENARLYRESQQAVALRDEFVSLASHELRTPLTSLQLHVEGLLRSAERGQVLSPERYLGKLRAVEQQVGRQQRLVGELLDFSGISAGGLALQLEPVELGSVVREVLDRFEEDLAKKRCVLELAIAEPVTGIWDRPRLDQVVTNLIENALKYAPGKPIAVRLRADEESATLDIVDRGPGIAAADHERIFQRFERAVSRRNYGGFGLGLWLVREIVTRHGGSVSVESQPGEGASFRVVLPRRPAERRHGR
ncbi:MAG TPA: PAS domain S-box protein [Polyangiaceae bacterium]|nr:PAS domain S-box protein [Polyangiaceae bacterium]